MLMLKFKNFALFTVLISAFILPLSCKNDDRQIVTLRFWNGFTGPDGRTMLNLVKRFNEKNPNIHVLMQRMDWATYYNKLFVAGLGHRAPEVFVLQSRAIQRFAKAGYCRANDDLISGADGIDVNDIDSNVWDAVVQQGKHYALPLDVFPMGMYYNRKLFKEAGIVDAKGEAKPPATREEFMEAMRKITKPASGKDPAKWGFVFTNMESNAYTIMRQFGGEFFSPDYAKCNVNQPENVEALQLCADLIRKYHYAPSPENFDAWIGFRQGNVGMVFEGIYMLADLQKQKDLDFAGAPVPLIGTHNATWADSHTLCMRSDLEGAELKAAWKFEKFLSDNSLDWADGGQVPVRKSLRATDRFRKMTIQSEFAKQIPYVAYVPRLNFVFEYLKEYSTGIEKGLRGTQTPKEALDLTTKQIDDIIAEEKKNSLIIGGKSAL